MVLPDGFAWRQSRDDHLLEERLGDGWRVPERRREIARPRCRDERERDAAVAQQAREIVALPSLTSTSRKAKSSPSARRRRAAAMAPQTLAMWPSPSTIDCRSRRRRDGLRGSGYARSDTPLPRYGPRAPAVRRPKTAEANERASEERRRDRPVPRRRPVMHKLSITLKAPLAMRAGASLGRGLASARSTHISLNPAPPVRAGSGHEAGLVTPDVRAPYPPWPLLFLMPVYPERNAGPFRARRR